jgi:predicted RNA binding protein YcfA (HicA-like mRNA interferase family)
MSQFEKFLTRVMQERTPKDIMPEELQNFMLKYGFELRGKNGSHYVYTHKGLNRHLSIPMHSPVKPIYIDNLKSAIIELKGDENEE